jgi:N-ethylmaleimide reductase
METLRTNKLFTPIQVGSMELKHRVVMAPLTRSRSVQPGSIPGDLMLEYYSQRASDGGLIVSEGTSISIAGGGWFGAPGLYSDEQVAGWKRITNAVHGKRGHMFSQLWHTGRAAHVDSTNDITPVSSSVNAEYWHDPTIQESTPHGWQQPSPHRALDIREIPGIVEDYRKAAEYAKAAGFDGVELHAGNGYLPDQFLQDGISKRTDMYGGSIENRSRLLLQVVEAMVSVWGGNRVAVRIAPSGTWNGVSDRSFISSSARSHTGRTVRSSTKNSSMTWWVFKTDRRYVSVSVPRATSLFVAACFQYPTVKRCRTWVGRSSSSIIATA